MELALSSSDVTCDVDSLTARRTVDLSTNRLPSKRSWNMTRSCCKSTGLIILFNYHQAIKRVIALSPWSWIVDKWICKTVKRWERKTFFEQHNTLSQVTKPTVSSTDIQLSVIVDQRSQETHLQDLWQLLLLTKRCWHCQILGDL